MATDVTDATFESEVLESGEPVLVDFWAEWCGPCHAVSPVLERIAEERNLKLVKVNIDENQDLAMRYGIQSIPNMILFEGGQPKANAVGAMPKGMLERSLGLDASWLSGRECRRLEPALAPRTKTSLVISTRNTPGALYHALGPFAARGVNMTKLESRPSRARPWEYIFYLDVEGDAQEEPLRSALNALHGLTPLLVVLGSYPTLPSRE